MKTVNDGGAHRSLSCVAALVLVAVGSSAPVAWGQSSYTWNSATTGTAWLNSANWTAGPASTAPGVDANASSLLDGNAGDVATFNTLGFTGSILGIDMRPSANTGIGNNTGASQLLTVGAIDWRSTTRALTLGKSDNVTATSTLRLTGATVTPAFSPVSGVLLSISDAATTDLTIAHTITGGTGTMDLQLGITGGSVYVKTGRNLTVSSRITEITTGSGITKLGVGTLTLSGANTFTGDLAVQSGVLSVGAPGALGIGSGQTSVASGAAVSLKTGVSIASEALSLRGTGGPAAAGNSNGALQAAASATATWGGSITLDDASARIGTANNGTLIVTGAIQDGLGNILNIGAGNPGGTGTVILSGANTYTGMTHIIRGTLQLGADNALPTTTVLDIDSSNAAETATFDLAGYNQTLAGLQRSVPAGGGGSLVKISGVGSSTLTVVQAIDTEYSGAITGSLSLVKDGAGQLTLTGANSFTGDTLVTGGILAVGADALAATSAITVTSGGTLLLADSGDHISDLAPLTLAGGTFDFGALSSTSENLGALILAADSIIDFGAGTGNTLRFSNLALGAHILSIHHWTGSSYGPLMNSDPGTPAAQDRLLFDTDPGIVGITPQVVFYSDAGLTPVDLGVGRQVLFGSPTSAFEIVPVPEPGTLLSALGLLGLIGWRERSRLRAIVA